MANQANLQNYREVLGRFTVDCDGVVVGFEYQPLAELDSNMAEWAGSEFPHAVWVGGGGVDGKSGPCGMVGYRAGMVLRTVAYVVVDEHEGKPVVEKWNIKKHNTYTK